jgi:Na+-transporting methylmalonyl-CoA/oxaloacetate decarboxylase gamma subunit
MFINVKGFVDSLPILLYGMAGIFVVIGIIAVSIKLMSWVFPCKKGRGGDE